MSRVLLFCVLALISVRGASAQPPAAETTNNEDEQVLAAAGLRTDTATLLAFFRGRSQRQVEAARLDEWMQRFASTDAATRTAATEELLALGPLAVPALRR